MPDRTTCRPGETAPDGRPPPCDARLGPRPLALHMAHAELAWKTEAPSRLQDFLRGVRAYRDHPYRRIAPPMPSVWQLGASRLVDYGSDEGWPLLAVPSLVNRAYVLDLMPGAGLLSFLRDGGVRPFLLDWGVPEAEDRLLTLDDYIQSRMDAALDWIIKATGRKPLMLGYCMGGTLATALACRRSEDCAGLALLATPWDFQNDQPLAQHLLTGGELLSRASGLIGSMSVDQLQAMFALLDRMAVPNKFADFANLAPASDKARRFVAIEDWLNDSVPLGADLASTCLTDWYGQNAPALGNWKVGGEAVRPEKFDRPAFLAIPSHDRIVPAASALALAHALPKTSIIRPSGGHVGMVAGRHAKTRLWKPLLAWFQKIAAMQKILMVKAGSS